jgi:4-hydroxyphenylpyruvate dioxygenase-like putative hemolysin
MSFTSVPNLSTNLSTEHQEWLKSIEFYDKELDFLEDRLTEIATKNTGIDALKAVEHFQNQFIVQRNTVDELRHKINEHIQQTTRTTNHQHLAVEKGEISTHEKVKEEVEVFEKIINDLRSEFKNFLRKWM